MISSFRNFLIEEDKTIYFTFGRMNPPTIGHEKLTDALSQKSGGNPYRVYLSQSQDSKKNPLDYNTKIKYARKMFPRHARSIILDKSVKNIFDIAVKLYDEGYKNVVMVVGSDRVSEFAALLNKYDGVNGRHGFYKFNTIKVISAGDRDPDAEGVEGMSASKMRNLAQENDFASFSQGLPKRVSNVDAKGLFNAVRKGLGLSEEKSFKRHLELIPVSEEREKFVKGNLFSVGNEVVVKVTEEVAKIVRLGTNYVVIESNGKTYRKWIDDVELLEQKHRLDPNLSLKHQLKHTQQYQDKDVDGDVDKFDKNTPDELTGVPNELKKMIRKYEGEKKHTGLRKAYEAKIEVAQDKDIDELPGSQPASFQKGIKSKSTKAARHRHFQKMTKKADDDPSAYKDAPGDKAARKKGTKPSQYTKKFKQMFGDD